MLHKIFLNDEAEAELAKTGLSVEALLYDLLGVTRSETSAEGEHDSLAETSEGLHVLAFQSDSGNWYAIAPGNPYTCSRASTKAEAVQACKDKVKELLSNRQYSRLEQRLQVSISRGCEAARNVKGKAGVVALGTAIASMFDSYGAKDKPVYYASFILACLLAVNSPSTDEATKQWASEDLLKHAYRAEAIEDFIEEQCRIG